MRQKFTKYNLATFIFIALVAGAMFGYAFPAYGMALKPIGDMFIRMIKMIVVPLVFTSLVVGIASNGDFKQLGRLGIKSFIWFEFATIAALVVGVGVANILKPGQGVTITAGTAAGAVNSKAIDLVQMAVNIVPANIVDAMARGDLLQIVLFSIFFGVAAATIGPKATPVLEAAKSITEIMFKFTEYVMRLAPIGVFALVAYTVGKYGLTMLLPLGKLIFAFYFALALFLLILLVVVVNFLDINAISLVKFLKEPIVIAFSTTSSEAALPLAMEKLEKLGIPKHIVGFVLPTGYVFNLDGATLYSALAVVFIAQVYGVPFGLSQQIIMLLALMLSTKGLAAVPGAVLIVIAGAASAFGLPAEGIALLIGIDRILDMGRTTVNLIGNCIAAIVVAVWENKSSIFKHQLQSSLTITPAKAD